MKKVLLVEDDTALRMVLRKVLSKKYNVLEAENGEEAIEMIHSASPDLILLDLLLPGKTGFDVLNSIRIEDDIKIPVVVLSNLDENQDIMRAKNLTADCYLVKSNVSMDEIVKTVDLFISKK